MQTPQVHRTAAGETVLNQAAAQLVAQAITAGLRFCEGFEDDELQEGMAELLADQRAALALFDDPPPAVAQLLNPIVRPNLAEIRRLNAVKRAALALLPPGQADDSGQLVNRIIQETLAEIRRLNAAAGETVFNPAVTQLLIELAGETQA